MPILEILLHQKTVTAVFIFTLLSIIIEIVGWKIILHIQDETSYEWIFERIFVPLARAFSLMIFMLLCYPILFGVTSAPPLDLLLSSGSHRINTLMNILFVLPLLFSLIPVAGKLPALILPIQGIAGASLIFSWMQAALPLAGKMYYIPDMHVIIIIGLMAYVSHKFAKWASAYISTYANQRFQILDSEIIIYRVVIVVTQLPVILVYTRGLGVQL